MKLKASMALLDTKTFSLFSYEKQNPAVY